MTDTDYGWGVPVTLERHGPGDAAARRAPGQRLDPDGAIAVLREWARRTRWVDPRTFADPAMHVTGQRHTIVELHQVVETRRVKYHSGPTLPRHQQIASEPALPPPTGRGEKFRFVMEPTVRNDTCGGCRGSGTVACVPQVPCGACSGSGNVMASPGERGPISGGRVFCGACSGRGSQICGRCQGSGVAVCGACRGGGTLWSCQVLEVRRKPVPAIRAPQRSSLPFEVRRRDWEPLIIEQVEVTSDERRQLQALANVARAPLQIGEQLLARAVKVTCVQYVDPQEARQTAWIVGPSNRVVAPAATAYRRHQILHLAAWVVGVLLTALILTGVALAVADAKGVLG